MRSKILHQEGDLQTFVLVFDKGEEVISVLEDFARENALDAAHFEAIGAFESVTLGYFQRERTAYKKIPVDEQVEVLSCVGNVAKKGTELKVHAHVVLGRSDGSAIGGHLLQARVWPTLEMVLEETPAYLQRTLDPGTGLALISPEA